MLTLEYLRARLSYDAETGIFRWITGRRPGQIAGTINGGGYHQIEIEGVIYSGHRLAWFYCHGRWPVGETDHIDGCRENNRLANLRECSTSENQRNRGRSRRSSTGYKGVYTSKDRFRARIVLHGKIYEIGAFLTPEEAHAAYIRAAKLLHGEFAKVPAAHIEAEAEA